MNVEREIGTLQECAAVFIEQLTTYMSSNTQKMWKYATCEVAPPETEQSECFAATVTLTGSLSGDLHIILCNQNAVVLAAELLGEPREELAEAEKAALIQLIESTVAGFCVAGSKTYGIFTATAGFSSTQPLDTGQTLFFSLTQDAGTELCLQAMLSAELSESINAIMRTQVSRPLKGAQGGAEDADQQPSEPVNLELVLDVELSVTLRFGQRQLTLREVLELTSGSVIELDRQVDEPVELLLEGKVIARGEAVVIDGNYGLRVTEVPQQLIPNMMR